MEIFQKFSNPDNFKKQEKKINKTKIISGMINDSDGKREYRLRSENTIKHDHISISMDMEHEPRRVGVKVNGEIKKRSVFEILTFPFFRFFSLFFFFVHLLSWIFQNFHIIELNHSANKMVKVEKFFAQIIK